MGIFLSLSVMAQLPVAFPELRIIPTDSAKMAAVFDLVNNQDLEAFLKASQQLSSEYLDNQEISHYLFIRNQTAANVMSYFQDLDRAFAILTESMEAAKKQEDTLNIEYAMLLKFMGANLTYKYMDAEGTEIYKRGLNIMKAMGVSNILSTDFIVNTGNSYVNQGKFLEALPYLEQGMDESLANGYPMLYMLVSQGYGYVAFLADVNLGIELYEKVQEDTKKIQLDDNSKNKFLSNIYHMLSGYYDEAGNPEKQHEYEVKALEHIEQTTIPDIFSRFNIYKANLYTAIDNRDIDGIRLGINNINKTIEKYHVTNPNLLINNYFTLMQAWEALGETDSVSHYKELSLQTVLESVPKEKPQLFALFAKTASNKQDLLTYALQMADAYLPGFTIQNPANDSLILTHIDPYYYHRDYLPTMKLLARYYLNLEEGSRIDNLQIALKIAEDLRKTLKAYADNVMEYETGLSYSSDYEELSTLKLQILSSFPNPEASKGNWINIDRVNIISGIQSFYLQKQIGFRHRAEGAEADSIWTDYFKALLAKNQWQLEMEQSKLLDNPISDFDYQQKTQQIARRLIRNQILLKNDGLLHAEGIQPVEFEQIQAALQPGEGILNYYFGQDNHLYKILITNDLLKVELDTNVQRITDLCITLSRKLKSGEKVLCDENRELTLQLTKSFKPQLQALNKLIIIPHGELFKIPFEILSTDLKKMWVETYAISYNNSLNLWYLSRQKQNNQSKEFIALAPGFKGPALAYNRDAASEKFARLYNADRSSLEALPFSVLEVENIQQLMKSNGFNTKQFIGNQATETNFKVEAQQSGILHLATHGFVSKIHPEFSGLFFHSNDSLDDAYLFRDEIAHVKFNSHLVVLSSCNSGTGPAEGSEGINSLQRYLILSGVPNVIASLWKVHDQHTLFLMEKFYAGVAAGDSYTQSLQKAKKECIRKGLIPLDWAGFTLVGE